jgi:hypothetical protein
MRGHDFERIRGPLLETLERLTVAEHRAVLGGPGWTPPQAYRWIRYENPDPVAQLMLAGERLEALWLEHRTRDEQEAFEKRERSELARALRLARGLGYTG